ncbi:hypothetical protein I3843_15G154000 [Carya illinoinensis]|nr:hypothetical protein I3843_15G154000 [Carya illinoinensis]
MKLQLWKEALKKVADLAGFPLIRNENEAKFIEGIVQDISRLIESHSYLPVAKYPTGLASQLRDIMNLHLSVGTNDVRMVGILGLGGIGKTSLAKAIWNSIAFRFEASCFLANVSDHSNRGRGLVRLQETLYSKIFRGLSSLEIDSIDSGINIIKHILHSKRVLLILDGVDHITQLETLAGACDWFGEGSRIIITTRDQHLLFAHGVDSTYKMKSLNYHDALQLFCRHAFKEQKLVEGYDKFVEQIISYAGGLPLALIVLGSELYGRSESEWKHSMEKYKQFPHRNIQDILQTSYDGLGEIEKNVFLDIACFFNGQLHLDDVIMEILDSSGFFPHISIKILRDKCLISKFDGRLQMHNLLRDMGREIVRQESPENPGARSRLFFHKDVRKVLEDDTGTYRIEAIVIDFPEGDEIIHLSPNAFKNMKRLRLFRCINASFSGKLNCLPNSIRVLDWLNCPLQSMPSKFRGDNLFILQMVGSHIQEICFKFKKLMVMNFRGSEFLTKISDISRCPNLKQMDFKDCKNLVEVHDSVASHAKLVRLNLSGCNNLKRFPRELLLRYVQFLDALHGSQLSSSGIRPAKL